MALLGVLFASPSFAIVVVVTNTNALGPGSLREAVDMVNASADPSDNISFNISGSGPHIIPIRSTLLITKSNVSIDGTLEPSYVDHPVVELTRGITLSGSTAITVASGATNVRIFGLGFIGFETGFSARIDGAGIRLSGNGNRVELCQFVDNDVAVDIDRSSGNAVIKNVIIENKVGIRVSGADNSIEANSIGVDRNGIPAGNRAHGVLIAPSLLADAGGPALSNNSIGPDPTGRGNVISDNKIGIEVRGDAVTPVPGTQIKANRIGTDQLGTFAIGNRGPGILLFRAPGTQIGGPAAADSNVISANKVGIMSQRFNPSTPVVIENNLIGTDLAGSSALPNTQVGILLLGAANHIIGGLGPVTGNVIAFNRGPGIAVEPLDPFQADRNPIRGNAIFENRALGIDLFPAAGVTANDPLDVDIGGNELQNFPELTLASSNGGLTQIDGILDSKPNTQYNIDFYANAKPDPSGHGEGQFYLGTHSVTTDPTGRAIFTVVFAIPLASGSCISSTATDPLANTSEFSACQRIEGDEDSDEDETPNSSDNCPNTPNDQSDSDGNGIGDDCDSGTSDLYVVDNTNASGTGSLSNALALADADDHVRVQIPGAGPHVIPVSGLVFINGILECRTQEGWTPENHNVYIDGSSLPGATPTAVVNGGSVLGCNFNNNPNAGVPAVQVQGMGGLLDQVSFGGNASGTSAAGEKNAGTCLAVVGSDYVFQRIALHGCGAGAVLDVGDRNRFEQLVVGTNRTGDTVLEVDGTCFQAQGTDCELLNSQLAACSNFGAAFVGSQGCTMTDTCIGTDATCTTQPGLGASASGVIVQNASDTTLHGGVSAGNALNGIDVISSQRTSIHEMRVGRDLLDGGSGLPNAFGGIVTNGDTDTAVMDSEIGGHSQNGLVLDDSTGAHICGNTVGLGIFDLIAFIPVVGSVKAGIRLEGGTSGARIGNCSGATTPRAAGDGPPNASASTEGNYIAYNDTGVALAADASSGNELSGNSFFDNFALGIDLGANGAVNPNDLGDVDGGPNLGQNFPVLTSATGAKVQGSLESSVSSNYRLEFFSSQGCDVGDHGEGEAFLGATHVTTDVTGSATIDIALDVTPEVGSYVTATATDAAGNTSEFSACIMVPEPTRGLLLAAGLVGLGGLARLRRGAVGREAI